MAVTSQNHPQLVARKHNQQFHKKSRPSQSLAVPALKAGKVGGLSLLVLMLLGLVPPPDFVPFYSLAILVVPGFFVVALATGLLAGLLAEDQLKSSQRSGEVGWLAGFWSGIFGGIFAMFMAAQGIYLKDFGQGLVRQFTPEQLAAWAPQITPEIIALAGRVFAALVIYGLIGSLVLALISSIGGMIYFKLK